MCVLRVLGQNSGERGLAIGGTKHKDDFEPYWQDEKDWLCIVEFLPTDDPDARLFAADVIGYLVGYANLTNTRSLALLGDPDASAYENEPQVRGLALLRTSRKYDFEPYWRSAFHCDTRSIMLKPPGEPHRNRYGDRGAHCLIIEINKSLLGRSPDLSRLFGSASQLQMSSTTVAPNQILRELRIMDTASALSVEGLAFELMGEMLREKQRRGGPIEPACLHAASEFLHDNFSKPIRLRDVAGAAGVHPAHLAKLFRRFRHCSVGEYLRLLRLRWALGAISASRIPIAQIALEAGFCDQAHFSNVCKRVTGISPSRVRGSSNVNL